MNRLIPPNIAHKIMSGVFWASGLITLAALLIIIGYVLFEGMPVVNLEFLLGNPVDSGRSGGIFPFIMSSIYVTLIAVIVATPLGVGAAVYLSEYAGDNTLVKVIRFGSETLASIPSIIFGLFGLAFFVIYLQLGWSVLSGGLTLALMAFPTILSASEVSIESINKSYAEGSLALGATKWQTIYKVVIPAALPGITTGVILGMGRAVAEAAAVLYTVGAALIIPTSLMDAARPLPLHLYILATEGLSIENAWGTAAVLVIMILIITVVTNTLVDNYRRKMMGR